MAGAGVGATGGVIGGLGNGVVGHQEASLWVPGWYSGRMDTLLLGLVGIAEGNRRRGLRDARVSRLPTPCSPYHAAITLAGAGASGGTVNAAALALGLIGIGAGSLLAIFGVRFFWVLLTVSGAMVGFVAGADVAATLLGEGYLATVAGWIAGIAGAVLVGAVAAAAYWAAVVVLSAGVGYALGSGILVMLGVEPGLLTFAAGLAVGAVLAAGTVALRVPVLLAAVLTSFGGTGYAIAGGLLILGRLELADLQGGALGALRDSPLALVAWLGLGAASCAYQLAVAREDEQRILGSLDQSRTGAGA